MLFLLVVLCFETCSASVKSDNRFRDAVFIPHKGMALMNHVISSHHVTSPIDCSFFCSSHDKCKSYNYKPRGAGDSDICQLNNATRRTNSASYKPDAGFVHYFDQSESFKSCLDHFRNGAKENGIYTITDISGDSYPVFCDLTSEPRFAWTLILSQAFRNRNLAAFCSKPLPQNYPLNADSPNWEAYRLSLGRMQRLSQQSTHVRVTTSFPEYNVEFRDYFRTKLSHFDILSFYGSKSCFFMEIIDVRNHKGFNVTVGFWQLEAEFLHTDTEHKTCQFDASRGSLGSENNFGSYCQANCVNPVFRGCEKDDSTTNYWFGGYM
ncbi:uncharacterized protein LOC110249158 [Exaiptasia diaphana]|uniref:Apple domain-containing protein n=1 Tax=Exaiptasia diaphana TaxID=2652724 RepID=A0A913XYU5_EXADI|nr:uncharacterized protein LOC110249158 [Exaiptasia diaphana]